MWPFSKNRPVITSMRPMVSIRMEAIGGQGANSAGKILVEAAVLGMKYTGNHFSSFGSEKRGSPVRSFVRFSPAKKAVRSASFIKVPDILLVFHESLLISHTEILEGVGEHTILVLNTTRDARELSFPKGIAFQKIVTLDASSIASKNQCGLNAVMLGACAEYLPEINFDVLEQSFLSFFSKLSKDAQKNNLSGLRQGEKLKHSAVFKEWQATLDSAMSPFPRLGFLNAPIGGLILNPGNTVLKDNSASRKGVLPRFLSDVCFHCGYCDMACPDFCFVWKREEGKAPKLQGIDYQFCKGCQKCIVACPVQALVPTAEDSLTSEERSQHLFPEATANVIGEKWRKADWSKAVSEMSPDAKMLSLQTELLDPNSYIRPDFSKLKKDK